MECRVPTYRTASHVDPGTHAALRAASACVKARDDFSEKVLMGVYTCYGRFTYLT